jgi:ankyrin repeat protein
LFDATLLTSKDSTGNTPLCLAAKYGHDKIVEMLLSFGADSCQFNDHGETPLLLAAENDHCRVVEYLLAAGAKVNALSGHLNVTALFAAVRKGYENVLKVLYEAGADASVRDWYETALHLALWRPQETKGSTGSNYATIVDRLLRAGADVHQQDSSGRTVLHLGAYGGQSRTVKDLLAAGSDVMMVDKTGRTPLFNAASQWGNYDESTLRLLLAAGSDVSTRDWRGETALHAAAEAGQDQAVQLLLAAGADIDARTNEYQEGHLVEGDGEGHEVGNYGGYTALHLAAVGNREATVRILCSAATCLSTLTGSGETALSLAAALGCQKVVEILLAAGADVAANTGGGLTAKQIETELLNRARHTAWAPR